MDSWQIGFSCDSHAVTLTFSIPYSLAISQCTSLGSSWCLCHQIWSDLSPNIKQFLREKIVWSFPVHFGISQASISVNVVTVSTSMFVTATSVYKIIIICICSYHKNRPLCFLEREICPTCISTSRKQCDIFLNSMLVHYYASLSGYPVC